MKTKYAIKVANTLFPKGTRLRLANLEDMRKLWPAIAPEEGSSQVGVWFPGMDLPTIIHRTHIED